MTPSLELLALHLATKHGITNISDDQLNDIVKLATPKRKRDFAPLLYAMRICLFTSLACTAPSVLAFWLCMTMLGFDLLLLLFRALDTE